MQRQVDAPHERAGVGHQPGGGRRASRSSRATPAAPRRRAGAAAPSRRRGCWRAPGDASSASGWTPAPLDPVTPNSAGMPTTPAPVEREERQLRRRGEAAGRRERRGAAQLGAEDVRERVGEARDQFRRGVRPVVPLVEPEVAHAKVGGQVHDEARPGVEHLARHLRGLPVLERRGRRRPARAPPRRRSVPRERASVELGERRMHVGDRPAGLAPAGRHDLRDVRVLQHQPEQLAAHVPGGARRRRPSPPTPAPR